MDATTAAPGIARAPRAGAGPLEAGAHRWEAGNGASVLVRPIGPDDFEREREFVNGLSPQTGYQRLLNPRKPSEAEIQRWTRIDRATEGALVATVDDGGAERQVGVARYVLESGDGEAEFAIVIADAWQGTGVGRHLLAGLIELARASGVGRLVGTTLSENRAMIGLGRRLGFRQSRVTGAAIYTMLTLALRPEA